MNQSPWTTRSRRMAARRQTPSPVRTRSRAQIIALLGRLPERQRRIVFLRLCGFMTPDIGRMTRNTPRTIDRQLGRARRTLRELRRAQATTRR
jgi:DNA-directed RNA polymerase specialized sigma24 family protein